MEAVELLKKNELFKVLENAELINLAEKTITKHYPKNSTVINIGDDSSSVYLVKEGKLKVMVSDEKGKEFTFSTLIDGDLFGELSLLDNKPRSANVVAVDKCTLIILPKKDFLELIEKNPKFAMQVIRFLCQKIRFTNAITQSVAQMDVYERLRSYLYSFTVSIEEGGNGILPIALTHREIASHISSGREAVSKLLKVLEKSGYLSTDKKVITIHKKLPNAY
jgi:CRP/FNR family cyclic AMP-dependent transcriptional regulator